MLVSFRHAPISPPQGGIWGICYSVCVTPRKWSRLLVQYGKSPSLTPILTLRGPLPWSSLRVTHIGTTPRASPAEFTGYVYIICMPYVSLGVTRREVDPRTSPFLPLISVYRGFGLYLFYFCLYILLVWKQSLSRSSLSQYQGKFLSRLYIYIYIYTTVNYPRIPCCSLGFD